MVEKRDIRQHVEAALEAYNHAGAALARALADVETERFGEATDDLRQCADHLDETVEEIRDAMELAEVGLETGLIRKGGEEMAAEGADPIRTGELAFENLRRRGELEDLFLDDSEQWDQLKTAAVANDPLSGYTRFASFVSRLRNHVNGLRADVEAGEPADHLLYAGWRASTTYMRTKNYVQMLEYINRSTR